jgi:hypothetical protein
MLLGGPDVISCLENVRVNLELMGVWERCFLVLFVAIEKSCPRIRYRVTRNLMKSFLGFASGIDKKEMCNVDELDRILNYCRSHTFIR